MRLKLAATRLEAHEMRLKLAAGQLHSRVHLTVLASQTGGIFRLRTLEAAAVPGEPVSLPQLEAQSQWVVRIQDECCLTSLVGTPTHLCHHGMHARNFGVSDDPAGELGAYDTLMNQVFAESQLCRRIENRQPG